MSGFAVLVCEELSKDAELAWQDETKSLRIELDEERPVPWWHIVAGFITHFFERLCGYRRSPPEPDLFPEP